jgi:SAM-dependent methyltransferase
VESKPIARRNRVLAEAELWRPPLYSPDTGLKSRALAWLRRFFDPAAKTVWADLGTLLQDAEGEVLDVGCGAQPYRSLFPARCHYRGIDTNDAKAHFGYEVPDTLYYDPSGPWPVAPASISLAMASEVLEHVLEPGAFLASAFRCLVPGGRLILTVPFAARWHYIPHDYWRYTPSSLAQLLESAGFRSVRVYARGNPISVACYKVMALFFALIFVKRPQAAWQGLLRLCGLAGLPVLVLAACLLNATLDLDWGDDCLGYTVVADKPGAKPA